MSFSYQYGQNPPIDYVRLLISDTVDANHVFEDSEITMATNIQSLAFQSGQFFSPPLGVSSLSSPPVPYRRIAATLLDSIAANKSRLSSITQMLDVHLSPEKAAASLREQAAALREEDDNCGSFAIIEQVNDVFSFRSRFWKQFQRQSGGGIG